MAEFQKPERTWRNKFGDAFRGVAVGMRGQSSFLAHLVIAVFVLAFGVWLGLTRTQWAIIVLCITVVLAAEFFNRGLELLAKAIDTSFNPVIRDALDVASAAVLTCSLGAALAGSLVLIGELLAR